MQRVGQAIFNVHDCKVAFLSKSYLKYHKTGCCREVLNRNSDKNTFEN